MTNEIARHNAAPVGALALYVAGLAPGSRRAQLWRLERAARFLGVTGPVNWSGLTYRDAVAVRAQAAELYAPRTASAIVAAVRAVAREAWRAGLMDGERYRRIQSVAPVKGSSPPPGRYVTRAELRDLLLACGDAHAGARDAALLAVLFGCGLRRGEASALTTSDLEGAALVVRSGKGRKGRRVPVGPAALDAMRQWLAISAQDADPKDPPPFLRAVNKGGAIQLGGMSGEAIRRRLSILATKAGIDPFRPHDARRSYASALLDAGVDLAVVARLMGHASVQITAGYDRRGARAETEAASLVRFPFGGVQPLLEAESKCADPAS
jgi:integrase